MLPRPFRTEVRREALPNGGNLQVLVRLRPDVATTDEAREALDWRFRDLSVAAAWGAMAGDTFRPETSTLELLRGGEIVAQSELLWTFAATNVHGGVLLVIENLVHAVHLDGGRVDVLRIHADGFVFPGVVPADLPGDYEPHPFAFEYGVAEPRVLVDVDFDGRHQPSSLEPFRPAWKAWEGLAVLGAFADATYRPGRASLAVEDDLRLTSTGLSGAFDDVTIADAGFRCLVNMLQTLHHRVVPIATVVIE